MKKSILNTAITLAISSALLSVTALNTPAYADSLSTTSSVTDQNSAIETGITEDVTADLTTAEATIETPEAETSLSNVEANNEISDKAADASDDNYMYSGMGVGAIAGTAVAGPVGFVVGGLIGAFIGSNQNVENEDTEELHNFTLAENTDTASDISAETSATTAFTDDPFSSGSNDEGNSILVAQLNGIEPVIDNSIDTQQDAQQAKLLDIMTADLSLDVYFRSGSTDVESFYPARLAAIADLLNAMDDLEIHLDGYTDRRGDKSQNIALANERIEKVRQQLIDAGVDENRIISKAFGEMKMVSAPGDLDGYTFDRKVVIRFERSTIDSIHNMKTALSDTPDDDAVEASISPVAADAGTRVADADTRF